MPILIKLIDSDLLKGQPGPDGRSGIVGDRGPKGYQVGSYMLFVNAQDS